MNRKWLFRMGAAGSAAVLGILVLGSGHSALADCNPNPPIGGPGNDTITCNGDTTGQVQGESDGNSSNNSGDDTISVNSGFFAGQVLGESSGDDSINQGDDSITINSDFVVGAVAGDGIGVGSINLGNDVIDINSDMYIGAVAGDGIGVGSINTGDDIITFHGNLIGDIFGDGIGVGSINTGDDIITFHGNLIGDIFGDGIGVGSINTGNDTITVGQGTILGGIYGDGQGAGSINTGYDTLIFDLGTIRGGATKEEQLRARLDKLIAQATSAGVNCSPCVVTFNGNTYVYDDFEQLKTIFNLVLLPEPWRVYDDLYHLVIYQMTNGDLQVLRLEEIDGKYEGQYHSWAQNAAFMAAAPGEVAHQATDELGYTVVLTRVTPEAVAAAGFTPEQHQVWFKVDMTGPDGSVLVDDYMGVGG